MGILSLFNLFYIFYLIRAVQLLVRIVREWASLKQEPLTRDKKSVAGQASFFIAVPPSVIVHELSHALAIWYFGGRVVDYGFSFYGGYVRPDRLFPASEQWLISIAGTIGSLVFGLLVWFVLRKNGSSTFRFFGLRTLRTILILSLVFYPLLALGGFGDWATIYDFRATPVLSGLTAVTHLTILALFYRADRRGWFEMPAFTSAAAQNRFTELEKEVSRNPHDKQLAIRYIDGLSRGGAAHKATTYLKAYLRQYPDDAEGFALLAGLEAGKKNHIPKASKQYAEKALNLGVTNASSKAMAYRILGEYALERNQYQEATNQFSQAIATVSGKLNKEAPEPHLQTYLAELYSRRSIVYRRQRKDDLAVQDIEQAIQIAQKVGDNGRVQFYTQELANIQQHAGRQLGKSTNAPTSKDVV